MNGLGGGSPAVLAVDTVCGRGVPLIVVETVENALTIPETALHYRGEVIFAEVVSHSSESQVEERELEIGIVDGSRVQVTSGLEEGEQVRLK